MTLCMCPSGSFLDHFKMVSLSIWPKKIKRSRLLSYAQYEPFVIPSSVWVWLHKTMLSDHLRMNHQLQDHL